MSVKGVARFVLGIRGEVKPHQRVMILKWVKHGEFSAGHMAGLSDPSIEIIWS